VPVAQDTLPERTAAVETAGAARPGRLAGLRRGGRAGWRRTLLTAAAGLVMWLAFPPVDWTPLAPVGVAVLTLALRGLPARTGAWLGFVGGAVFFIPVLEGISAIGPDGWIVLSLVQALYFVPMGAGIALVTRLPGWPVWTAALWVAQELLRGRVPFGGFPWARLAFSQTASPLTPWTAVGGAPLVSFLTALLGGLLAYAAVAVWRARRDRRETTEPEASQPGGVGRSGLASAVRPVGIALAGAAAIVGGGFLISTPTAGRPVTGAVVQGNVPRLGLDYLGQRRAVLDNHVRRTHELAAQVRAGTVARPELVVWPENASDLDPYAEPDAYQAIDAAVKDIGVPVLASSGTRAPDRGTTTSSGTRCRSGSTCRSARCSPS
jgi:apolipoprotein N-acyltransferase